jgi:mRNA-degrading endonuclease toxin of MazEF toxin-antitoxin module
MGPGEIHLGYFPFGGTQGRKLRPVLLLTGFLGTVPEILVAYMTSVVLSALLPTDLLIDPSLSEYAGTNLKGTTLLRLHKLATVHRRDVIRPIGALSPTAMREVEARLRSLLNL